MLATRKKQAGFTIVELLVVIVVIAVLASIAVVGYNGITRRADHSAIITHLRQWETIFESYIAMHGRPPAANWRCLGDATTLPAENGYAENFCFKPTNLTAGNGTSTTAPVDPALMDLLLGVNPGGGLPSSRFPESPGFTSDSDEGIQVRVFRGIFYDGSTNNFADSPAVLGYYAKGTTCPAGERVVGWTQDTDTVGCAVKLSINQNGLKRGVCNLYTSPSHSYYNYYMLLSRQGGQTRYCYQGNIATL